MSNIPDINVHTAQYFDPFHPESRVPKIPDDQVEFSTGAIINESVEVTCDFSVSDLSQVKYWGVLVFMVPGGGQSFMVVKYTLVDKVNDDGAITDLKVANVTYVGNNGAPFIFKESPMSNGPDEVSDPRAFVDQYNHFHAYRYVSHGTNIQYSGNESNGAGVFEAISTPLPNYIYWAIRNTPRVPRGPTNGTFPYHDDWDNVQPYFFLTQTYLHKLLRDKLSWVNNPSYQTGLLKDLDQQFNLPMLSHSRPFIRVEDLHSTVYSTHADTGLNEYNGEMEVPVGSTDPYAGDYLITNEMTAEDKLALSTFFDTNFNMWVFHIPNPNNEVRFHVRSQANLELIPLPSSFFQNFVTANNFQTTGEDLKNFKDWLEKQGYTLSTMDRPQRLRLQELFRQGVHGGAQHTIFPDPSLPEPPEGPGPPLQPVDTPQDPSDPPATPQDTPGAGVTGDQQVAEINTPGVIQDILRDYLSGVGFVPNAQIPDDVGSSYLPVNLEDKKFRFFNDNVPRMENLGLPTTGSGSPPEENEITFFPRTGYTPSLFDSMIGRLNQGDYSEASYNSNVPFRSPLRPSTGFSSLDGPSSYVPTPSPALSVPTDWFGTPPGYAINPAPSPALSLPTDWFGTPPGYSINPSVYNVLGRPHTRQTMQGLNVPMLDQAIANTNRNYPATIEELRYLRDRLNGNYPSLP